MTALSPLLLLTLAAIPQDPQDDPGPKTDAETAAILAKVDAATLGGWKHERPRLLRIHAEIPVPGMDAVGEFREHADAAGRAQWVTSFPDMGRNVIGTDGTHSWSLDPVMGVSVEDDVRHHNVRRLLGFSARRPWKELYRAARLVGDQSIDERPHWVLEMIPAEGDPDRWFVDQQSALVTRLDTALPDPNGGWLPMQMHFSDFRTVDGVPYPRKRIQRIADFAVEYRVLEVEHPETLPEGVLDPPAEVARAIADPARRTPKATEDVRLRELEPRHVASIRMKVAADEVSKGLAIMLPEVMAHLTEHGIVPAGAPFSRYHHVGESHIDLEAGIPVAKPITGNDRVKASKLPGGRIASSWHLGPYHDLAASHARVKSWIEAQELQPAGALWEVYWTDPGLEPDPAKWRTEVLWPVKD